MRSDSGDDDFDMIEQWLRRDPTRWLAGAVAGLVAAAAALVLAMILAKIAGRELWYPIKLGALPLMSLASGSVFTPWVTLQGAPEPSFIRESMELGFRLDYILAGLFFWEFLGMFFGAIYAHFAITNDTIPLLGVGAVWGAFSWIFIGNLFLPAWKAYTAVKVAQSGTFPVMMTYGLVLASVSFFDRAIRGNRSKA